jgi:hypothetical protein
VVTVSKNGHIRSAKFFSKMHALYDTNTDTNPEHQGNGNRSRSTNDKEDVLTIQLQQYAEALRVLSKYPDAMKEFCLAVGGGIGAI